MIGKHIGVLGDEPMLDWYDKYLLYKGQKLYDLHRLTHTQTEDGMLNIRISNSRRRTRR